MEEETVLLTSYFNLADGRRQEPADTFRVDAPVEAEDGSDNGALLYIVTEATTGGHMGPRARRLATELVAWAYGSAADEPPAIRLKRALKGAHTEIFREFDGHVAVGLTVIAIEEDAIYLGQVAPAQVYVMHEGSLHSLAATADGSSPFARALGSQAGPRISVFRDEVGPDDIIALCSSWFHLGADPEDMRECFGAGGADEIAEALLTLATSHGIRDATAIVIEAVRASEISSREGEDEAPITFMEQVDSALQALAGVGKMLRAELRPASAVNGVPASEPESAPVGEPDPGGRSAVAAARIPDHVTTEMPLVDAGDWESSRTGDATVGGVPPEQTTDEIPAVQLNPAMDQTQATRSHPRSAPSEASETIPAREREQASELDRVNSRIHNAPELGDVIPPVQAFPDTSTHPERIYATSKDIQAVNRRPRRFGGIARPAGRGPLDGPPVIRPGMSDVDLRRPATGSTPRAVIWISAAVLLLLVAATGYVYIHNHSRHAVVNPYPAKAQRNLRLAAAATTPAAQDAYLAKVRADIALARTNGASTRRIAALNAAYASTSDTLHRITRVPNPQVLSDFSKYPNAQPAEITSGPGIIFVLDSGRKGIYSVTPNATSNPNLVVQTGDQVNGFTVDKIQHIAVSDTTILALDAKNVLVRVAGTTKTATALSQQQQTPQTVVSMATATPADVYLLDTANSQVWRYPDAITGFSPPQSAFFQPAPKLSQALQLMLDSASMYILQGNGTIQKFEILNANPQPFAPILRVPFNKPTGIFANRTANFVWVADPTNQRVVQIDKTGRFIRSYQSAAFSQIKSMAVGPAGNTIYVLAGSKLYDFPVVH